ncbi:MAG: GTP-binding protein [Promethearchaeota archaeon]
MGKYHSTAEIRKIMDNIEQIRNIAFVGHIDHGKTTLSDSLLAEAGLLSESLAGEARALDYLEEEQRRGITMKAANVSLYYEHPLEDQKTYVINLVDTPGHLDFTGKVTRALRLVDGVVVVVDAVEEINAQSETVLRQALEEGVRPLLFINKIDRLFNELNLDNEEIQQKFSRIITKFNSLIERFADKELKNKWAVKIEDGSVMFGSALHRWGFTLNRLKELKWNFSTIYEKYEDGEYGDLKNIIPVWETVLSMVIFHIPHPKNAQKYRISKIWDGDPDSILWQSMTECDPKGPLIICMSNIKWDPHGLIATGRIFSGTISRGQKIYLVDVEKEEKVQRVGIYMGARIDNIDSLPAGNIVAISGLKYVRSGETIVDLNYSEEMTSFENVKYISEPVVTVSIEPESLKNLENINEYLNQLQIEDPNLIYSISNETGEILLSGMGPLHLEVACKELEKKGIEISVSKPMSVYRESIAGASDLITIHDYNGQNSLTLKVERNEPETIAFLNTIKLSAYVSYEKIIKSLIENTPLSKKESVGYMYSDELGNLVINMAENLKIEKYKGRKAAIQKKKERASKKRKDKNVMEKIIFMKESTIEELIKSLKSIFLTGPLAGEKLSELKITIHDIKLVDYNENDFTSLVPLFRNAIFKALKQTGTVLLEPIYHIIIQVPQEFAGNVINILNQHQSKITAVEQMEYYTEITAFIAVREYIDFVDEIRSATSGRAFWQAQFHSFKEVPDAQKEFIIQEIRFRKGWFF